MQVTYFLNGPIFCFIIVILFYIERKQLFIRNLALRSQLSGKFQRFNAIDESIKMMKNS